MTENELSHLDKGGKARMVDTSGKLDSARLAVAAGEIVLHPETLRLVRSALLKKGDVFTIASTAGIMAAKKTAELIPLCHNIPLNHVDVLLEISDSLPGITIKAEVKTFANTGAEMEALTAVSVAALTVYDMVKSAEKTARIQNIRLLHKSGGKSGEINNP